MNDGKVSKTTTIKKCMVLQLLVYHCVIFLSLPLGES